MPGAGLGHGKGVPARNTQGSLHEASLGSVIAKWFSVPLGFQVSVPVTVFEFTLKLYCVIRPVFMSYPKESASEDPSVTPVGRPNTL
jgi:hypothetical protein